MAVLFALGLAVLPEILPAGPTGGLDAAGFLESGRMFVAIPAIFLGGLLTSTLLNLLVVPSLYLRFGKGGNAPSVNRAALVPATNPP